MSIAARNLAHAAIAVLGALCLYIVVRPLFKPTADLVGHLLSGSWDVQDESESLNGRLRYMYGTDAKWKVSYVAGSSLPLRFDDEFREATINDLGQLLLADSDRLEPEIAQLGQAYANLIYDPLADHYLNAKSLRAARDKYASFAAQISAQFPSFQVVTIPDYASIATWQRASISLPQSAKCAAKVYPLGPKNDADPQIAGFISVLPNYVEVRLSRPWMSDTLLDEASRLGSPLRRYFEPGAPLRIVPTSIWIAMSRTVQFERFSAKERGQILSLAATDRCCQIECPNIAMEVTSRSLVNNTDGSLIASEANVTPLAYAIVSRRRAPEAKKS